MFSYCIYLQVVVRLQASEDFVGITFDNQNIATEVSGDMTACVRVRMMDIVIRQCTCIVFHVLVQLSE